MRDERMLDPDETLRVEELEAVLARYEEPFTMSLKECEAIVGEPVKGKNFRWMTYPYDSYYRYDYVYGRAVTAHDRVDAARLSVAHWWLDERWKD